MTLRPYQSAAIRSTYGWLSSNTGNPIVVIPTGGGKTPVIATMCYDVVREWAGRVLVLSHVKELLEQTRNSLLQFSDLTVKEIGIYSAGLGERSTDQPVILAGIQSVWQRMHEFGHRDLILIDECHLVPPEGDGMYRNALEVATKVSPQIRVVGLSATPYRTRTGLVYGEDQIFHGLSYEIGIRPLIEDGFLCPLKSKGGITQFDLSNVHTRGGEFIESEMQRAFDGNPDAVWAATKEFVALAETRKSVLVFTAGVEHAGHIAEGIRTLTEERVDVVTGETSGGDRERAIEDFKRGSLRWLVNVNVLTTGFDAPNVDCVVLLRATKSPGLYYQMCLDMETEVLTQSGWRRCHEVATGDVVAAFDLDTEEIVYTAAVDKVHRSLRLGEKMFGVSAPHLDIRVTDQHTMIVRGRARTCLHWQLQTAVEASQRRETFTIPVAGRGGEHRQDAGITDAEGEFIGWFLTDGCKNHANGTVVISQSTKKFAAEVRSVLTACGFGFREYLHVYEGKQSGYADGVQFVIPYGKGRGTNHGLRGWKDLEEWLDKDIPAIFNTLSQRQFAILLGAMNKGNGRNATTAGYVNRVMAITVGCRQRMADRIQQLAVERGYRCNVSRIVQQPNSWNKNPQPQWMIYVKPQCVAHIGGLREEKNELIPERCRLQEIEYQHNEWVWCLTTEKGTLVTRRNGKVAIVGNCGRGFRLHPGKTDALVLDFGGNILRHGPVDELTLERREANKNGGEAPAKECEVCRAIVPAGCAKCPECGHVFPEPKKAELAPQAETRGILAGQVSTSRRNVLDWWWTVHRKRGADEGKPPTLRVTYSLGLGEEVNEYLCFEHTGYARTKAVQWWLAHAPAGVGIPKGVNEAWSAFRSFACPASITIRETAGKPFPEVVAWHDDAVDEPVGDIEGSTESAWDAFDEVPF